jgi:hypothetical protein
MKPKKAGPKGLKRATKAVGSGDGESAEVVSPPSVAAAEESGEGSVIWKEGEESVEGGVVKVVGVAVATAKEE